MPNESHPQLGASLRGFTSKATLCLASLFPNIDAAGGEISPANGRPPSRPHISSDLPLSLPHAPTTFETPSLIPTHSATPERITDVCDDIRYEPRAAFDRVKNREDLLLNPRVIDAITDALRSDFTLSGFLAPSSIKQIEAREALSRCLRHVLNDGDIRNSIVDDISKDLSRLRSYPREILLFPDISHAARTTLNQLIAWGTTASVTRDAAVIGLILSEHGELLPDLAALATQEDQTSHGEIQTARLVATNPRADRYFAPIPKERAPEYEDSITRAKAALRVLGIEGIDRLDNWREVIINRWLVSDTTTRERIEDLLGPEDGYDFAEALKKSLSLDRDARPLCVFIMPRADNDQNGAFLSREIKLLDNVDILTSGYQVVYHEATSAHHAVNAIKRGAQRLGKSVDLLVLAGHGDPEGISLDRSEYAALTTGGRISINDMKLLCTLNTVMSEGAQVILASCSTAKDVEGRKSFARHLHETLSHVTLHAANAPTGFRITCHSTGLFKEIEFFNAHRLVFKPGIAEPHVEKSANFGVESWARLWRCLYRSPLMVVSFVAGWALLLGPNLWRRDKTGRTERNRAALP